MKTGYLECSCRSTAEHTLYFRDDGKIEWKCEDFGEDDERHLHSDLLDEAPDEWLCPDCGSDMDLYINDDEVVAD